MRNLTLQLLSVIFCLVSLSGCAASGSRPIHPGAVNTFDSVTYDTLITSQAALEQARQMVETYPQIKPELNKAIDGYNTAMNAYKVYHAAAVAGKTMDPTDLAQAVEQVSMGAMRLLTLIQKGGTAK